MASNSTTNSTIFRHPGVDGERDTPEDLYNNVYEWVNCQVSNDPPADGMAASLTTCNITQFFCGENTAADGTVDGGSSFTTVSTKQGDAAGEGNTSHVQNSTMQTRPVTVLYDYEVYYNPAVELENNILPYLDESMLEHVATAMGLVSCRRRRLASSSSASFPQEQLDRFVGVTRDPVDEPNERYSKCQTNTTNIFGDMPPVNEEDGTPSTVLCLPIQGGLTVFSKLIMNDDLLPQEDAIRSNVLAFLEEAMDNDLFVVPTSIEKVVFVGDYNNMGGDAGIGGVVDGGSTSTTTTNGSDLSGLDIALIGVGGALFLLLLLICCCCCWCCRRKRRRRRQSSKERNSSAMDRHVQPVWDSSMPDEEEGQGGMAAEGNLALADLDSLALEPQHGVIKITERDEDDASNNTTSGTSVASSSPNRSKDRSRASSVTDDLELLDIDDNDDHDDHDDHDDDSLFEFREGSFSNSLRSPSDTSSRIRSNEFTTNQRGRYSPATTTSRSTVLHGNLALAPPPPPPPQQQQQQQIVQATPSNVTNESLSSILMSMAPAPGAVSRTPSTASGQTSQHRSVVARDAAYSPTNDDYDEEIMEITEDIANDGVSTVASGDSLRRNYSNVSARRNLQMT